MRLFEGGSGSFGEEVLRTFPASWKAKLVHVEPLYDLDPHKVVTATLVFLLPGLNLRGLLAKGAFDYVAAIAPAFTRWLRPIRGVRATGEGTVLTHDMVRCATYYDIGKTRGVFNATMTRARGGSTLLTADLVEWRR